MTYELHPLCTLFPRLSGAELAALVDDIRANGLREPIVLHEGMVLDGGNRYAACVAAGVEPRFVDFAGESVVSFVLSANLHRRHLTPGQQAAIVSAAQDWAKAQTVGKPKSGNVAGFDRVEDRAAQSGASERTQRMADKVAKANPELAKRVAHGEVSLPEAVAQVSGKPRKPKKAKASPVAAPEEPAQDELKELRARYDELAAQHRDVLAENQSMGRICDADDKLAAAAVEIKRLTSLVCSLEDRIRGLMTERNEAVRDARSWQRKAERLMKVAA